MDNDKAQRDKRKSQNETPITIKWEVQMQFPYNEPDHSPPEEDEPPDGYNEDDESTWPDDPMNEVRDDE